MPPRTVVITAILAGQSIASAANQTWVAVAPNPYRQNGTQTLLNDGRVLETGGNPDYASPSSLASLYNPVTNAWAQAASLQLARYSNLQVTPRT